jgi:hypothetical protein
MLSEDIHQLAATFARYSVQGGRFIEPAAARALYHVLADLAEQAAALERQVAPPAARVTPAALAEAGGNVILLLRRAPPPPGWLHDGGPAA